MGTCGLVSYSLLGISFNVGSHSLKRVELLMFECPEWGISVQTIKVLTASSPSATASLLMAFGPTIMSCDSLVRVCLTLNTHQAVLNLQLFPFPGFKLVHLAEVIFIGRSSTCPPDQTPLLPHPHYQIPLHLHYQIPLHLHHQIPPHLHHQIPPF
jgi:hypothetical protein